MIAGIDFKRLIAGQLSPLLGEAGYGSKDSPMTGETLHPLLEVPPDRGFGDFAVPCFRFAKSLRKNPAEVAAEFERALRGRLPGEGLIARVAARGPYLNLFLRRGEAVRLVVEGAARRSFEVFREFGQGKTVVVDFSSPNIAKPFGIGHLRSTVIGNSLGRIFSFLGHRVIGINHLGDWGTQFGKLITAYKRWGDDAELERNPIKTLFDLYVRFHREAEEDPAIEEEGRSWFARLENGDGEALAIWERFRGLSLEEFKKIYARLGVGFDHFTGESFYGDMLEKTVRAVIDSGISEVSEGALIVPLEDMPPALVQKSDDATLYLTRDLAAAIYRHETFAFDLALYVVGSPQALHFRQLFAVLEKMGHGWVERCHHVPFGQISFEDGAMSTRKGKIVLLEEVLDKARGLALRLVEEKNPGLRRKEEVAEEVGVGAIIFNDLKNGRVKDITFKWEEILNFDGETGPYLQYTHARIASLLGNFEETHGELRFEEGLAFGEEGYDLALLVNGFEEAVLRACREFEPSAVSRWLLELASAFNTFYNMHRVVGEDRQVSLSRALLVREVKRVLGAGLGLLGIAAVEEM